MFNVQVYNSLETTSQFYRFIGALQQASEKAEPSATHRFIKMLESKKRLLRCYTQNIDGLEERAGLASVPLRMEAGPDSSKASSKKRKLNHGTATSSSSSYTTFSSIREPRLVHLHGKASLVRCSLCTFSSSLYPSVSSSYALGQSVPCPACSERKDTRVALGRRANVAVGVLRPAITLYGQQGGEEELRIGQVVEKDLEKGPDCLIVMGTSLKVSEWCVRQSKRASDRGWGWGRKRW